MDNQAMIKPAYPRPDKRRDNWMNLNGEWDFSFEPMRYDKKIIVPFSWASPLSGIAEDRPGEGYYRKAVTFHAGKKERVFLVFGAVDYLCEVQINGIEVGTHLGGYSSFEFDVTDAWNAEGENIITVKAVDNNEPYQTSGKQGYGQIYGIWQTVYLETRPMCYIDHFVIHTKLNGTVSIDYRLNGDIKESEKVTAFFEGQLFEGTGGNISFQLEHPHLWDTEDPYLYEGSIILEYEEDGSFYSDQVYTYFGIREIGTGHFGAENHCYITLNGKPIYLRGVLDQSFNPKGYFTLPTDEDCKEEILRVKRLGLNMARIHIKSEEPLKLYWADKLGVLIMEDIPCFWGEPTEQAKELFESQTFEIIDRDINHPAVFYWVIFNESWGLFHFSYDEQGKKRKTYLPETQEWVRNAYYAVKKYDESRLVEDNSVCNRDHVETDVNTWHFYADGYERVKATIEEYVSQGYEGSCFNYIGDNCNGDVPSMNSECGNVWGYKESAGDSDLSWQYKYMMNEFRRLGRNNGFVFTELHDVINEFNGYYRIDNTKKDLGYQGYVPGMTVNDLHADDYLGMDFPPITAVAGGGAVTVPLFGSSFSDRYHGQTLKYQWRLCSKNAVLGSHVHSQGERSIEWKGYGSFPVDSLTVLLPEEDTLAVLELYLKNPQGEILMRNFTVFDVSAPGTDYLTVEPKELIGKGFTRSWTVQDGSKCNGLDQGEFSLTVSAKDIPQFAQANGLQIILEASARQTMSKDLPSSEEQKKPTGDMDFMHGYRVDRGANPNAFFMTDEDYHPSDLEILIDGVSCGKFELPDCPADSRGCLSWEYQPYQNNLSEAGSYGYLCRVTLPAELTEQLKKKDQFTLLLRATGEGLSIYGRKSGRYPCGIIFRSVK